MPWIWAVFHLPPGPLRPAAGGKTLELLLHNAIFTMRHKKLTDSGIPLYHRSRLFFDHVIDCICRILPLRTTRTLFVSPHSRFLLRGSEHKRKYFDWNSGKIVENYEKLWKNSRTGFFWIYRSPKIKNPPSIIFVKLIWY